MACSRSRSELDTFDKMKGSRKLPLLVAILMFVALCQSSAPDPYPEDWPSEWWYRRNIIERDNSRSMFRAYIGGDEYTFEGDVSTASKDNAILLVSQFTIDAGINTGDTRYYVRFPEDDTSATEMVKLYYPPINADGVETQLMVHSAIASNILYCDFDPKFENQAAALCEFDQIQDNDEFVWSEEEHPGPHSRGGVHKIIMSANGAELYGLKARLFTPELGYIGDVCVQFWYFMKGTAIDSLAVYIDSGGSRSNVWQTQGDQSNAWTKAVVYLTLVSKQDKVGFEAGHGSGDFGDILLDEISINRGICAAKVLWSCDFDDDTLCPLNPVNLQGNEWVVKSGPTPTADTGPSADFGGNGSYLYVESDGKEDMTYAQVYTSALNVEGDVCLTFAVHMYGADVYQLSTTYWTGASKENHGSIEGDQGDSWKIVMQDHRITASQGIGLEAGRGNGNLGDIAIDDIIIYDSDCEHVSYFGFTTWDYFASPVDVLVKHPFNFSASSCPFHDGLYHVEAKTQNETYVSCLGDTNSTLSVSGGTITFQTCLTGNTYEEPFQDTELFCMGELPAFAIGSTEVNGKVLILAHDSTTGVPSFYTARYQIPRAGIFLMSLQGSTNGKLQPKAEKRFDSVGSKDPDFDYAFSMIDITNECPTVPCSGHGNCVDLLYRYLCECDDGFYGEICDIHCPPGDCNGNGRCIEQMTGYHCECQNLFYGNDCEDYLSISIILDSGEPLEGEYLNLICLLQNGTAGVTFLWTFMPNTTGDGLQISTNQTYSKWNLTISDSGNYSCEASTKWDTVRDSILIEVSWSSNNVENDVEIIVIATSVTGSLLGLVSAAAAVMVKRKLTQIKEADLKQDVSPA